MDLIIVDCQNDFISGTMASENGEEAVKNIVDFMNKQGEDLNVYYTSDFHPENHMSFVEQGGPWPSHCVAGTMGAEIHDDFHKTDYPPNNTNTFFKGRHPKFEEYSGFEGRNGNDIMLKDAVSDEVHIVGIASEYCVLSTALEFLDDGKKVIVHKDMLGYVDKNDHEKALEKLSEKGVEIR